MNDPSTLRKQIADVVSRRNRLINATLNTKPYIAAQVTERYRKCHYHNCHKCSVGQLHGPFLSLYQNKKGQKTISTTVKHKPAEAREMAKRYEHLQALRLEIRQCDRLINDLLNQYTALMEREVTEYVRPDKKSAATQ